RRCRPCPSVSPSRDAYHDQPRECYIPYSDDHSALRERITMATFVLVHGAWHGGWCYKRVAKQLRHAGHEVYTPTLTGVGEGAHLMNPTIDRQAHVEDILGVIRCEELSDFVLCGHSYGGMVISGVAEKIPEKIRSLVYLDAFAPADGRSLFDLVSTEMQAVLRDDARENGEGYL